MYQKEVVMSRKSKLFFSLVSLCFSIAVLCFGVYSALSVSYSISGSVSYEIKDVFVSVTRKVYRALSETPVQSSHSGSVTELKTAQTIDTSKYDDIGADDSFSTYDNDNRNVTKPGQDYTYPEDGDESKNIDLTYGSPTGNETQGYAFYIVIDIHNLGSEIINAQITAPTSLENTILRDSGNVEITAGGTERIVLGLALDDVTTGIKSAGFTYKITISRGELPIEPITDMTFSIDEATKTATLTSYTGTGTMVEIPETIGAIEQTTKTLGQYADISALMTSLSGTSTGIVDAFLVGDITYDGLDEPIENQMIYLWMQDSNNESCKNITIECKSSYTLTLSEIDMENYLGAMMRYGPAAGYIVVRDQTILDTMSMSYKICLNNEEFNIDKNAVMQFIGNNSGELAEYEFSLKQILGSSMEEITISFENIVYGDGATEGDEYTVTSIGSSAFADCDALTSIEIPSRVTSIGERAFDSCSALETVTFGANSQLESIGDNAFYSCSALEKVNITDIDAWATIDFAFSSNPLYYGAGLYLNGELVTEVTLTTATKISPYAFYSYNSLTRITIQSSVTSIGSYAFQNCSALQTVTFGANLQLESIGSYAFSGCSALETVTFGEDSQLESIGSYAFQNCSTLEKVTFGENSQLGSIGNNAFSNCSNLTSIEIPSSVTSIGYSAFSDCSLLGTVTFGEGSKLESIGNNAFNNCDALTSIEIPSRVTSIGDGAFNNCDALGTVTFGEGSKLEIIGNNAFSNCSNLTSIKIPSSVTSIGSSAFSNCSNLTSIEIPSGVTSIGGSTFNNCDALGTVTFGESSKLESIGNNAFYNCSNLNSIEIPSRVTSIGERAFEDCSALKKVNITDIDAWAMIDFAFSSNPLNYGAGLYLNGELVTEVTLTTATKIGDYAFNRYDSLTSITIPSSVTSIGSDAFNNCSLLGTVTFGEGSKLESIGSSAFSICSNLTSITIPSGVTSIGDSAFYRCTSLTSIEIPSSVASIGGDAFSFCDALKKVNITDIDAWAMIDFGWRGIKINPLYYGDLYLNGELVTEVTLTTATKIGDYAFYDYDLLTSITIPSSVTSIGDSAFYNCTKLESIAVDQNNSNYSSDEYGVLFNKDKTELIQYPVGNTRTQYTIPSSVTSIGDGAFSNCSALETVTFGEDSKLEIIGNNAFYNCSNLTSIKIPSGVTGIGSSAFYDCSKLSSVYIDGQAVANMLTGTNDPGGLLGNIGTSEKVYINNTLTLTGGAKTYMESNFEIVTSDVSGYVCYQKK